MPRYFFCMVLGNLESITVPFQSIQLKVPWTFKNQLFLTGSIVQSHSKTSKYININDLSFIFSVKQNNSSRFKTRDLVYLWSVSFNFKLWSCVVTSIVGLFLFWFQLFLAFRMALNWIKSYWLVILGSPFECFFKRAVKHLFYLILQQRF